MSAEYEDVSFLVASKYRLEIVRDLDESPSTPSALRDRTGHAISHVSRTLTELSERGIVELLVPDHVQKGRIYGLTDHGSDVLAKAEDIRTDGNGADEGEILNSFDEVSRIKAQTRKLCEHIDDPDAAYKIREGAQLAIARRDA